MSDPVDEVRRATAADGPRLAEIDRLTSVGGISPAAERPAGEEHFAVGEDPADTLVALVDGVVAGYARTRPPTTVASNRHVLELHGFAVDPAFQRRGVGRRLLDAAVSTARRRGVRRLTLRVLGPNRTARSLYSSYGFVEEGVLRGEFLLEGRYVDDVLMALDLGDVAGGDRVA